jgi:hypothetical protein
MMDALIAVEGMIAVIATHRLAIVLVCCAALYWAYCDSRVKPS